LEAAAHGYSDARQRPSATRACGAEPRRLLTVALIESLAEVSAMPLSRRNFLRTVALGAAATTLPIESFAFRREPSRARTPDGPILLDANENPYGPFRCVHENLAAAMTEANRYPFRRYQEFIEVVASAHHVKPDNVIASCGSGELLKIAAEAFTGPGKKAIIAAPTFETVADVSKQMGAEVIKVPLTSDYRHDLAAMLARADSSTGLIFLCNPNNPTGTLTPRKDLEDFIARAPQGVRILVDEAYHHYASGSPEYTSFLDRPTADPRVFVTRTFSKVYGMAGMRLGYAVGSAAIMQELVPRLTDGGTNMLALRCGTAAFQDSASLAAAVKQNATDRAAFEAQARKRNLRTIPSYTNFVMVEAGRPVLDVIKHFRQHNIRVGRPFPPYATNVRVSLGTPGDMGEFWRVWDLMA
jgi:histidinol-phosphate aminotransferase